MVPVGSATCREALLQQPLAQADPPQHQSSQEDGQERGTPPEQQQQQQPLPALPNTIIAQALRLLPPEDIALNGRTACKEAAQWLTEDAHRTLHVARPLPLHAATLLASSIRTLPLKRKLSALAAAAASGSETNVDMVLRALEPCVFPLLLRTGVYHEWFRSEVDDPGVAAVRSGHAEMLPMLLERCRAAMRLQAVLGAAARYLPLTGTGGLQDTWHRLKAVDKHLILDEDSVFAGAMAGEGDEESVGKLDWLVGWEAPTHGEYERDLGRQTAEAVLASGSVDRILAALDCGCPALGTDKVLEAVLRYGSVENVKTLQGASNLDWRCRFRFPSGLREGELNGFWLKRWRPLIGAAAGSGRQAVAKLALMQREGMTAWGPAGCGRAAAAAAARAGNLEVIEYLLQLEGGAAAIQSTPGVVAAAAASGSCAMAVRLLQLGCPRPDLRECVVAAASEGHLEMLQWLLSKGGALGIKYKEDGAAAATGEDSGQRGGGSGGGGGGDAGAGPSSSGGGVGKGSSMLPLVPSQRPPKSLLLDVVSRWPDRTHRGAAAGGGAAGGGAQSEQRGRWEPPSALPRRRRGTEPRGG